MTAIRLAHTGNVPPSRRFRVDGGIIVATDAAVNPHLFRAGAGFVATSGLYGVSGHPQPPDIVGTAAVAVAELRAAWLAIEALDVEFDGQYPVTVLMDSPEAIAYLRGWQHGKDGMPAGYQVQGERASGRVSSLERLAARLQLDGARFRFARVRGHCGHALNEAADSLARIGLRAGTRHGLSREQVPDAAEMIARNRLDDYWDQLRTR